LKGAVSGAGIRTFTPARKEPCLPRIFRSSGGPPGKTGGEELAPAGVRAIIFRMAFQIDLQRESRGFRLMNHPDTRRQGGGEEIGDQRVMGAAEDDALGAALRFPNRVVT